MMDIRGIAIGFVDTRFAKINKVFAALACGVNEKRHLRICGMGKVRKRGEAYSKCAVFQMCSPASDCVFIPTQHSNLGALIGDHQGNKLIFETAISQQLDAPFCHGELVIA